MPTQYTGGWANKFNFQRDPYTQVLHLVTPLAFSTASSVFQLLASPAHKPCSTCLQLFSQITCRNPPAVVIVTKIN